MVLSGTLDPALKISSQNAENHFFRDLRDKSVQLILLHLWTEEKGQSPHEFDVFQGVFTFDLSISLFFQLSTFLLKQMRLGFSTFFNNCRLS
jgi:hypothetical protein